MTMQELRPDPEGMRLLPAHFAQENDILIIAHDLETITVAIADEENYQLVESLQFLTGRRVRTVQAPRRTIRKELHQFYEASAPNLSALPPKAVIRAVAALLIEKGTIDREELNRCLQESGPSS